MIWGWGIGAAIIAVIGWGIGDFLIQRSTRIIGGYRSLFIISAFSFPALLPFVYREIGTHSYSDYAWLTILSFLILGFALVLFEAFRVGKLSVIEAIVSIELPLTVGYAVFVGGEMLTKSQTIFFILACVGVLLTTGSRLTVLFRARFLEKGVLLALAAAILSALTNYYLGRAAQEFSPLFAIWYTHTLLMIFCGIFIAYRGEFKQLGADIFRHPRIIMGQALFDNVGWIAYAFAVTMIPISIAVTISESYIILAALLGYFVGKERLRGHQKIGAIAAFAGVLLLSFGL